MKKISRREFVQLCAASAAALGLSQVYLPQIAEALEEVTSGKAPVIWLQGGSCTGCSISLLNSAHPSIKEVLVDIISLEYHPNVMAGWGDPAIEHMFKIAEKFKGKFFLAVEGAVPIGADGMYCTVGERNVDGKHVPITFMDLVKDLGSKAAAVLSIGTCAAYGGVAAAAPNPTECVGVQEVVKDTPVVNIPGCPPHPDWIIGTLAHVLLFKEVPDLDKFGRPKVFFGPIVHDNCPRRQYFDNSIFAEEFGQEGCLLLLGCKAPFTNSDCSTRQWNNGVNWCIKAGSPCLGCTHPGFPDDSMPFYQQMKNVELPGITAKADTIGKVAATATAVGLGAHLAGNIVTGRVGNKASGDKEGNK